MRPIANYRLTDVIGHKFNNAQLIADQFAANGYLTVVPDLFHGDAVPLQPQSDFDFATWIKGGYNSSKTPHFPNAVDPVVEASLKELRTRFKLKVCVRYRQDRGVNRWHETDPDSDINSSCVRSS